MQRHFPLNPTTGVEDPTQLPWTNGVPQTGQEGSYPPAGLMTDPQDEILHVIDEAGIAESGADLFQLLRAIRGGQLTTFTDTGAVNAMVITPTTAHTALTKGLPLRVFPAFTNTSQTVTLKVGILTANVFKLNGTKPAVGDIVAGQPFDAVYDTAIPGWRFTTASQASDVAILSPVDNLLINPEFDIDQRNRGDNIGSQTYKYYVRDRWRCGPNGATITFIEPYTINLLGDLEQVVEAPNLQGETVSVSVDNPTGPITVTLTDGTNTVTGTIPAGTGPQGVIFVVPPALTGDLTCRFTTGQITTFIRPRIQRGNNIRPFVRRPYATESLLCHRYYYLPGRVSPTEKNNAPATQNGTPFALAVTTSTTTAAALVIFHIRMRILPTLVVGAAANFGVLSPSSGTYVACQTVALGANPNRDCAVLGVSTSSATFSGAGQATFMNWLNGNTNLAFDAEFN